VGGLLRSAMATGAFGHLDGGACSDRVTPLFISCKSPARSVLVYDRVEIDFSLTADDC
jgi:hypothetical protein